jgi:hypothetical protein
MLHKKPLAVAKGQILRKENLQASSMDASVKNPTVGFVCLHYSVSEASGYLLAKILNKKSKKMSVGVRTIDGEAKSPKDYDSADMKIDFEDGQSSFDFKVKIKDDDEWEPDQDFFIELYDLETKERLTG